MSVSTIFMSVSTIFMSVSTIFMSVSTIFFAEVCSLPKLQYIGELFNLAV